MIDPRDGQIYYIGQTKDFEQRKKSHNKYDGTLEYSRWLAFDELVIQYRSYIITLWHAVCLRQSAPNAYLPVAVMTKFG